ncbi:hypothetical protein DFH05DRAFT_1556498 [Lentinula detonsa]|uniref:Uncharacterized protein n=1 Tax=Lentinula detonsa TaxID=2804962 RepID=A0A9W8P4T5_9AGAR|nr:hypothetical protein DFH05DRAFT_1556498 [Lentinula detonsa]
MEEAELLLIACALVAASDALDNNEDVNLPIDDLDEDVLELAAALMIQKVSEIEGDGTRGPYNQFPKSQDWFSTSLQQPDRWFRSNHRMSWNMFDRLVFILTPNAVFHSPKKKQWHFMDLYIDDFTSEGTPTTVGSAHYYNSRSSISSTAP